MQVAFIGFGEAAQAFVSGWSQDGVAVRAHDIKTGDPAASAAMWARYSENGVTGFATARDAVAEADVVFCTVTADQAQVAARAALPGLREGALWFDCNSCAPGTKRAAAADVDGAGGAYVDVAVMAPVYPKRHRVPLLVAGPHTEKALKALAALGMNATKAGDAVGEASTIKMLRSVMIKGMEAVVAECLLSARRAGVEEAVIATLERSDPEIAWRKRGAYGLERMLVHGTRRAAEMREVAKTVAELGLEPAMSTGSVAWQDRIGALGADPGADDLAARLDVVLTALGQTS